MLRDQEEELLSDERYSFRDLPIKLSARAQLICFEGAYFVELESMRAAPDIQESGFAPVRAGGVVRRP